MNNENKDGITECHTPKIEQKVDHSIKIKNGRKYGNTELSQIPSDLTIYPNTIVVAAISRAYDLQFISNKWEFKIKTSNNIKLNAIKVLDILIDNNPNTANCEDSDDIILCKVNKESQLNTQLIKLTDTKTSCDNIYLTNLEYPFIPLISKYELMDSSDIKYNNGWSFTLKVKNNNANFKIPIGSVFTIDINYNEDKEGLALCSESKRNNNEFTLSCTPLNNIHKKELITISTSVKSKYASVTFEPAITNENKYILFDIDLEVEYVSMIEFNESGKKWKFIIVVKEADIPLNARIKIDLKYNNENETATCILSEKNKFVCIPDILDQNINDDFSIWPMKMKGTTNLSPKEKLKFIYVFNLVRGYNLIYDNSKWSFDILLSECKAINGISLILDILVDDEVTTANCLYNDNILKCEVNYENQDQFIL